MEDKTTLEYLADALRLTHRAILAGNPTDEQKKLLNNSNLHLLLMESQLAGLGDGVKSVNPPDPDPFTNPPDPDPVTQIGALDGPFFVRGEPNCWHIGFFDHEGAFYKRKTESALSEAFHKANVMNDDRTDFITCHVQLRRCWDHNKRMFKALDKIESVLLDASLNEAADACREAMTGEAVPDQWRKTNSDQS